MSRLIDENTIIKMLNTMDRYTSEELTLCDTDETFPKNEVFIVDDVFEGLDELPSAQPELLEDGTLMITVQHGMLGDVKRVMVDEVGTKNCKVMYQDEPERGCDECVFKPFKQFQPERKKGEWVNARDGYDGHVKCNNCFKTYDWTSDAQYFNFCPNCGADMRGDEE